MFETIPQIEPRTYAYTEPKIKMQKMAVTYVSTKSTEQKNGQMHVNMSE
jgi:hypothetical protein